MLAQVLSIFNPVEDLAAKPDGEIPEKVSNISFISPEASWISWFVIALFFWAPPLFSAWILGRKKKKQPVCFTSRGDGPSFDGNSGNPAGNIFTSQFSGSFACGVDSFPLFPSIDFINVCRIQDAILHA